MNGARPEPSSSYPPENLVPIQAERVSRLKSKRRQRKPSRLSGVLASAVTWLFSCVLTGVAVTVTGVFLLAGIGWALIAIGLFLFVTAWLIRIGIMHG